MLIRFIVKNLFSFKEYTEFNMLPGRYNRLSHHIEKCDTVNLLRLNVLYGANGAGKSNLINALSVLRDFLIDGEMPIDLSSRTECWVGLVFNSPVAPIAGIQVTCI